MTSTTPIQTPAHPAERRLPWQLFSNAGLAKGQDAAGALAAVGADFSVDLVDLVTVDGHAVKNRFGVARTDTGEVFDVVGTSYTPVQNADAFAVADVLVDQLGATIEHAGMLNAGRVCWMHLEMPKTFSVANDEHKMHLYLEASHDGKRAVRLHASPVRLICTNQLNQSFKGAHQRWAIPHVSTASDRLRMANKSAINITGMIDAYQASAERLLGYTMGARAVDSFLKQLFPSSKSGREADAIKGLLESDTCETGRGTGYAVLQGVREYFDHVRPIRNETSNLIGAMTGVNHRTTDKALHLLEARAAKK